MRDRDREREGEREKERKSDIYIEREGERQRERKIERKKRLTYLEEDNLLLQSYSIPLLPVLQASLSF